MLTVGPELVGQRVSLVTRPEWGVGDVLRVQQVGDAWRVSIQFPTGHRQLMSPPAKFVSPGQAAVKRESGWLDQAAGSDLDAKLRTVPEDLRLFLGTALQKFAALLPLYELSDDPKELIRWATAQTGVSQPLTYWTRDELAAAFAVFCRDRDTHIREALDRIAKAGALDEARALLKQAGPQTLAQVFDIAPRIRGRL